LDGAPGSYHCNPLWHRLPPVDSREGWKSEKQDGMVHYQCATRL